MTTLTSRADEDKFIRSGHHAVVEEELKQGLCRSLYPESKDPEDGKII